MDLPQGLAAAIPPQSPVTEIRLSESSREREMYDNLADLYAIIKTTEALEKAYVRDAITAAEYTPACNKLIGQFRTAQSLTREHVPDVARFMAEYGLDCPAAVNRLLRIGVPATVEHGHGGGLADGKREAQHVAEAVAQFITSMDALKIGMTAVDQIHPLLNDLLESMNHVSDLPPDFDGKQRVREWLVRLNAMRASDELGDEQKRQLAFDLEASYSAFHRALGR